MKKTIILNIILLITLSSFSQTLGPWNLISYSGEGSLMGIYRELETRRGDQFEFRKSSYYNGGLKLNTRSYVWDKNFFLLEANGEFNPGTRRELNLVMPDRSEVRTYSSVDLRGTFFSENPFSVGGYLNLNNSFFNRETLTNIKSHNFTWGSFMRYDNKYVPITADFSQRKWTQSELPTGRVFNYEQNLLQTKATKSFTELDKHELSYSYNDFRRDYSETSQIHNIVNRARLYDNVYIDADKKYNFNSTVTYQDQSGSYSLQRLLTNENIRLKLPENFEFLANYSFGNSVYEQQEQNRHRARGDIRHKLFSSLISDLYYEYTNINRFVINETQHKAGLDLNYTKEIKPIDGRLNISYSYYRLHNNTVGDPISIYVINEEHILTTGGGIVLLEKENIDINSIVVRDETGLNVYQEVFDYDLIERGNYIEIQRLPGGAIPDGGLVLVDYSTTQPGTYKYDANYHHLYTGIMLYKRLVELYYRRIQQNYINEFQIDSSSLNYFHQNIFGIRLEYKFAQAGVEYDDYNSNIVPYKMMRYYLTLQKSFSNRVICSLNGSLRDYDMISYNQKQRFIDAYGRVSYRIKDISTLNVQGGYRKNSGVGIDLDIITFKTEIVSNLRKLYLIVGFEMYQREYLTEKIILNGGYVRLIRRF